MSLSKTIRLCSLIACTILFLPACKPKGKTELLVGSWRFDAGLAVATVTYSQDHTYIITVNGMANGFTSGQWHIEGEKLLTIVGKSNLNNNTPGKTYTQTIVKLDDGILIVKEDSEGKEEMSTFQRVSGGQGGDSTVKVDNVPFATPASSQEAIRAKIEGGFGKKLGDTFPPVTGEKSALQRFTPQQAFRSFTKYSVTATPVTHRIYLISADANFKNDSTAARKEQQVVMAMLQKQYGGEFNRKGGDEYELVQGARSITVEIGYDGDELSVNFWDHALYKEGEDEQTKSAQAESGKASDGNLFATSETPGSTASSATEEPEPAASTPEQRETPEPRVAKARTTQTVDDLRKQLDVAVQESAAVDRRMALQTPTPPDSQPADLPPTPTPRRLPEKSWDKPHIYLHIADESQRKLAETIKQRLTKEGWMVMGIENVATSPNVPETTPELRYFTSDDSEESQEIDSKIRPLLGGTEIDHNIPEGGGYVSHSRQYEFWFSRSFGKQTNQGPLKADQISSLDLPHLQTAIDEIYARHGTEFPKHETQAWADRQSWYHRVPGLSPDAAEQTFSSDERSNIELLAARRGALKLPPRK